MQRGFSLVETLIASALLGSALVALAQLLSAALQSGSAARTTTVATMIAEQKMEDLRGRSWSSILTASGGTDYFDADGALACPGASSPCPHAAYARRWSASPASFSGAVLIVEVNASALGKQQGEVTLVTARARMTP